MPSMLRPLTLVAVSTLCCFVAVSQRTQAAPSAEQSKLQYQDRGGRYAEGIKPAPVSAYDIELISVLADYKEPAAGSNLPDQLKVRFFLPTAQAAELIVRELDVRLFYWLDQVKPPGATWRKGTNEFAWTTDTVLRPLADKLDVYALGVVIRLGSTLPSSVEEVAPGILYHSKPPTAIHGYLFTLKVSGDARLSCSVYREGRADALATTVLRRIPGGRPFTVPWNAADSQDGQYRLVCTGFFLDSNEPVEQTIRFYHSRLNRS